MRQTVLVAGIEHPDAREAALWFSEHGFQVWGAMTGGKEAQTEELRARWPQLEVFALNPLTEAQACAKRLEAEAGYLDILVLRAGFLQTEDGCAGSAAGAEQEDAAEQPQRDCQSEERYGGHDYEMISRILDYNVQGSRELIEACLPLLRKGNQKRIALLTSAASSIGETEETENFACQLSAAALAMMMKIYFNRLRPEGFTFRCFAGGSGGMCAGEYIARNFCYDEKEPYIHSEENRLVMRDSRLHEIPW